MARIDELFHYLKENKGSDLHLAAGLEPRIRVHGSLEAVAGWGVLTHERAAGAAARDRERRPVGGLHGLRRPRLRLRPRRARPLPRQLPAPGERLRRRLPHHPGDDRAAGGAQPAQGHREPGPSPAGAGAGHRPHRLRQVHHPRGGHRRHQQHLPQAHRHHRGPGGVRAQGQALRLLPARGGGRHRELRRRPARRHPPGRRRHPGGRDAGPGDHFAAP